MREKNFDVEAFPIFFKTGKFGLNQERERKISASDFFLQRILNKDDRFRKSQKFLFTAVYYLERKQIESQIQMSLRKGCLEDRTLLTLENAFNIFEKIPGTFRYS